MTMLASSKPLALDTGKFGDEGRYVTVDGGTPAAHVIFIREGAGFVPKHLRADASEGKRFSRAAIERKLVEHHREMTGGDVTAHDDAELNSHTSGNPFTFHKALPEEVKHELAGNPHLRRLFRVTQNAGEAGGADTLHAMGERRYFDAAHRYAGSSLRQAKEFAAQSPDPEVQFLNAVHEALPSKAERGEIVPVKANELRVGQQFSVHGVAFRVAEDADGYRVLQHGVDFSEETPLDALTTIPVDAGSFKRGRSPARFKHDVVAPFSADPIDGIRLVRIGEGRTVRVPAVRAMKLPGGRVLALGGDTHKFSSTQINLPSEHAAAVLAMAHQIKDEDLAEDGRETDPHVTVRYGLHSTRPSEVAPALADESLVTFKLGKASLFPATKERPSDVIKLDVEGPDLHRLNAKLARLPHTQTHPTYHPHVTLAYVKPGMGAKYLPKMNRLAGTVVAAKKVRFSSHNGMVADIPLGAPLALAGDLFGRGSTGGSQGHLFSKGDKEDGVWRTIEGTHVFIRGGKITKGPHALEGKTVAEVKAPPRGAEPQDLHEGVTSAKHVAATVKPGDYVRVNGNLVKVQHVRSHVAEKPVSSQTDSADTREHGVDRKTTVTVHAEPNDLGQRKFYRFQHTERVMHAVPKETTPEKSPVQKAVESARAAAKPAPAAAAEELKKQRYQITKDGKTVGVLKHLVTEKGPRWLLSIYGEDGKDKLRYFNNFDQAHAAAYKHKPAGSLLERQDAPRATAPVDNSRQLGIFAKDAKGNSVEVGERPGQTSMFGTAKPAVKPAETPGQSSIDARIAKQYDPAATPELPGINSKKLEKIRRQMRDYLAKREWTPEEEKVWESAAAKQDREKAAAMPLADYLRSKGHGEEAISKAVTARQAGQYRHDEDSGSTVSLPAGMEGHYRQHYLAVKSVNREGKVDWKSSVGQQHARDYPALAPKGLLGVSTNEHGWPTYPSGQHVNDVKALQSMKAGEHYGVFSPEGEHVMTLKVTRPDDFGRFVRADVAAANQFPKENNFSSWMMDRFTDGGAGGSVQGSDIIAGHVRPLGKLGVRSWDGSNETRGVNGFRPDQIISRHQRAIQQMPKAYGPLLAKVYANTPTVSDGIAKLKQTSAYKKSDQAAKQTFVADLTKLYNETPTHDVHPDLALSSDLFGDEDGHWISLPGGRHIFLKHKQGDLFQANRIRRAPTAVSSEGTSGNQFTRRDSSGLGVAGVDAAIERLTREHNAGGLAPKTITEGYDTTLDTAKGRIRVSTSKIRDGHYAHEVIAEAKDQPSVKVMHKSRSSDASLDDAQRKHASLARQYHERLLQRGDAVSVHGDVFPHMPKGLTIPANPPAETVPQTPQRLIYDVMEKTSTPAAEDAFDRAMRESEERDRRWRDRERAREQAAKPALHSDNPAAEPDMTIQKLKAHEAAKAADARAAESSLNRFLAKRAKRRGEGHGLAMSAEELALSATRPMIAKCKACGSYNLSRIPNMAGGRSLDTCRDCGAKSVHSPGSLTAQQCAPSDYDRNGDHKDQSLPWQ